MEKEIFSSGKFARAMSDQSINIATATTTYGAIVDTKGVLGLVANLDIIVTTGQIDSITFQEGDISNLSDAVDIVAADLLLPFNLTLPITADALLRLGTVAKKRYIRLKIVTSGTVDIDIAGIYELKTNKRPPEDGSSVVEEMP